MSNTKYQEALETFEEILNSEMKVVKVKWPGVSVDRAKQLAMETAVPLYVEMRIQQEMRGARNAANNEKRSNNKNTRTTSLT